MDKKKSSFVLPKRKLYSAAEGEEESWNHLRIVVKKKGIKESRITGSQEGWKKGQMMLECR